VQQRQDGAALALSLGAVAAHARDRHAKSTNTSAPARTPVHSKAIASQSFMA